MASLLGGITEDDLRPLLAPQVRANISRLEEAGTPWNLVGELLAAAPNAAVALKGGRWDGRFWLAAKNEFHSFLCTESSEYADLRDSFAVERKKGVPLAVASLSGAIGAQRNLSSGVRRLLMRI